MKPDNQNLSEISQNSQKVTPNPPCAKLSDGLDKHLPKATVEIHMAGS